MKVEIWSDVMCPFCYLGKHKFENALNQLAEKEHIEVEWKSFQLQPDLKTDTSISIDEYLAREKGFPIERARQMNHQLARSGKELGLEYNFDKAVVANTFKAHNLLHFSKEQGKQNETEEKLFEAFFSAGKNIDDIPTLLEIGKDIGLRTDGLKEVLENEAYADKIHEDIYEAQQIGVRGVPFFVFDRKYGVSGAQETSVFLQTLEKAFGEWKKDHPGAFMETMEGPSCTPDGACDE